MGSRAGLVLVLAWTLTLAFAGQATGTIRYAAPGGTGKDPCTNPRRPCSVFTAADKYAPRTTIASGDVVELAPGTYYADAEGEFGFVPSVLLPAGVTVRGEPGRARPLIIQRWNESYGAFLVSEGSEVADVEVRNRSGWGPAISVEGGTVDRVIARSTTSEEPTCGLTTGAIRNSACLNSNGGFAVGANGLAGGPPLESVIRNSTLVATGPGSIGMSFVYGAGDARISAIGVLVAGEERDIVARGLKGDTASSPGFGPRPPASVRIELRASRYATVETEPPRPRRAFVTPPGTNGNITAMPLLANGNLRQLPGSPTIDAGAIDGSSAALDLDGQPRTMGLAVDIGADELNPADPPLVNSPPDTKLAMPPMRRPVVTPSRRAEFNFGSSDLGSRFECKLDRKSYRPCASPLEFEVRLGRHRFLARAIDPLGLVDATPAVFRWRVVSLRSFLR